MHFNMAMRRPTAAPKATVMRRPAASVHFDAFSLDSWKKSLDLGNEPDVGRYINSVYLVTLSRVLASTLGTRPDLRDPASLEREEIRRRVERPSGNREAQNFRSLGFLSLSNRAYGQG